tara:strand:+ start:2829 stop:3476 length:648 start_codon:yes stop_codon:yes gene_type:complete
MKICGIDEAGRGPVIGPLVIAGVMVDDRYVKFLKKLGVKDSKMLTKKRREDLFEQIKSVSDYYIIVVDPDEIDAALNNPDLNLNWLEAIKISDVINKLNPDEAIIDAPSTNIKAYTDYLSKLVKNKKTKLKLEHKADENYEVCSAASILAKVTRDREIDKLRRQYGDCGSGYPADPRTKKFLEENWDKHPEMFRKTWSTYRKVAQEKEQKNLSNY